LVKLCNPSEWNAGLSRLEEYSFYFNHHSAITFIRKESGHGKTAASKAKK
jgi:hypothetical protein